MRELSWTFLSCKDLSWHWDSYMKSRCVNGGGGRRGSYRGLMLMQRSAVSHSLTGAKTSRAMCTVQHLKIASCYPDLRWDVCAVSLWTFNSPGASNCLIVALMPLPVAEVAPLLGTNGPLIGSTPVLMWHQGKKINPGPNCSLINRMNWHFVSLHYSVWRVHCSCFLLTVIFSPNWSSC